MIQINSIFLIFRAVGEAIPHRQLLKRHYPDYAEKKFSVFFIKRQVNMKGLQQAIIITAGEG